MVIRPSRTSRTGGGHPHRRCNGVWKPDLGVLSLSCPHPRGIRQVSRRRRRETVAFAVRADRRDAPAMADRGIDSLKRMAGAKPPVGRSWVYWWLNKEYRRLRPLIERRRTSWSDIAAAIEADGLTGATGKRPHPNAVQKVWRRVCRDRADAAKARWKRAGASKRVNRSPRQDGPPALADTGPTPSAAVLGLAGSPRRGAPAPHGKAAPAGSKAGEEIELSPEAEAKFAALRAQLAHADRHFGPQPKRKPG
jgi:hypothetical protein